MNAPYHDVDDEPMEELYGLSRNECCKKHKKTGALRITVAGIYGSETARSLSRKQLKRWWRKGRKMHQPINSQLERMFNQS